MPAEFRKLGMVFLYPDNWSLDETDLLAGRNAVTVCSPEGAFCSIGIHPHATDPRELAETAVNAMREEYKELEVDESREELAAQELWGYDISFYYLDLINTATIRCFSTDEAVYSVFCQAEDKDFERLRLVFAAITSSLIHNLDRPHDH